MKKLLLSLLALGLSGMMTLSAQDYQNEFRRNEIKVNLAGVFIPAVEIQYDYILRQDMSLGGDVFVGLDSDYPVTYQITPNYRWFFGGNTTSTQKYGAGFFIEANTSVFGVKVPGSIDDIDDQKVETGFGLGVAVGWKYLSTGNWVGELFIGAGKNFLNYSWSVYPRGGLMIGYRF